MTGAVTLADLRRIDLFDDLDEEQLALWLAVAEPGDAAAGEILADMGGQIRGMLLLFEGVAQTFIVDGERTEPVGRQISPTWMGAISALTESPLGVRVQAETAMRIARVPSADFQRLALSQPAVHRRVMRQIAPVLSRVTAVEQRRERLAALGTMAAGLAHELNNPAAAAGRAAAQMAEALDVMSWTMRRFVEAGVERDGAEQLLALHKQAMDQADARTPLDALDAADAEDELRDRIEELGVEQAWRLAEPLAAAGVDEAWLDRVAETAGPATGDALAWVAATLTARGLAGELQEATRRMSDLVTAVKTYAYMDRGDLVEVDLHEGLETTLVVLGHKLRHASIAIARDYDRSLPHLTVRGSELNQVWTNLIDNAIQAIGESGTIAIATRRESDRAVVDITDDGPGIPPEIVGRIFDPFFTTKDVGHGTGLGLDAARMIVVERHDGAITVESVPGRTTFRVSLPFTPN